MAKLRLRVISILVVCAILLLPVMTFADSPAGTPADKVTKTTKTAIPAGAIPAGATITGITTTSALLIGTIVILGGTGIVIGVVTAETDGDDLTTNPSAAHHH